MQRMSSMPPILASEDAELDDPGSLEAIPPPPPYGTVLPSPPPPTFDPFPPPRSVSRFSRVRAALFGAALGGSLVVAAVVVHLQEPTLIPRLATTLGWRQQTASVVDAGPPPVVSSPLAVAAQPPVPTCPADMILVEGGKFFMGTDLEHPVLRTATPAHQVEVGSFCLDRTEVTVAAYRACSSVGECKRAHRDVWWPRGSSTLPEWRAALAAHSELCNESYDDRGDHPINCVTWEQARRYCEHEGKRLPSESEWEFAARGSDGRVYTWGDEAPDSEHLNGCGSECLAWRAAKGLSATPVLYQADDGFVGTAPVGSFPAGVARGGALDMAGNVFEWTTDRFESYPGNGTKEATMEDGRPRRVIRGGAFNSFMPQFADPALRFAQAEHARSHGIGFRCVASPSLAGQVDAPASEGPAIPRPAPR